MQQEQTFTNDSSNEQASFNNSHEGLYHLQTMSCPDLDSVNHYLYGFNNSPNIHPESTYASIARTAADSYLIQYDIYGRRLPNSRMSSEGHMEVQDAGISDSSTSHETGNFFDTNNLHNEDIEAHDEEMIRWHAEKENRDFSNNYVSRRRIQSDCLVSGSQRNQQDAHRRVPLRDITVKSEKKPSYGSSGVQVIFLFR
jgi:hypothetical protein